MARTATRFTGVLVVASLAMALLVVGAPAASAAGIRPSAEARMVQRINESRRAYGLGELHMNLQMVRLGREWARRMANENRVYHRPNLADVVDGDFALLGENVGYTQLRGATDAQLVDRLHRAFMGSAGHRAMILGRFNIVGVGIRRLSEGRMFVAVNFVRGPRDEFPLYRDYVNSQHRRPIARLFRRGAVNGCSRNRFCPGATGTRRFGASAIDKAMHIRRASNYVASSCGTSFSCRTAEMTRGEMAVMLAQAMGLSPVSSNQFTDVSREQREAINAVVRAGVMSPCSTSRFCPGREMSRGRIARTVYRALAR